MSVSIELAKRAFQRLRLGRYKRDANVSDHRRSKGVLTLPCNMSSLIFRKEARHEFDKTIKPSFAL